MPARIVIVSEDPDWVRDVTGPFEEAGFNVAGFGCPFIALNALKAAKAVDLLILTPVFGPGKPNGVSLALTARGCRPNIKVVFIGRQGDREFVDGIGTFLPLPLAPVDLVQVAHGLLSAQDIPPLEGG